MSGSGSGSGSGTTYDDLSVILGDHTLGDLGGGQLMFGTENENTIDGGAGNDMIVGAGGNDTLTGGAGEDALFGDFFGNWRDSAVGSGSGSVGSGSGTGAAPGSGSAAVTFNDYLDGGAGSDLLVGGQGNDTLSGGDGADVLFGDTFGDDQGTHGWGAGWDDPAFDSETGASTNGASYTFDDLILGGAGNDIAYGQLGDDEIYGGQGADTIFGGVGNDTLNGGIQDGESESVTLLSENFDSAAGGFTYADGAFGTSNGAYEEGYHAEGSGTDGRIGVQLGGIDRADITDGMSGAFSKSFNVSADTTGTQITITYQIDADKKLDSDEHADVMVAIDGQLYGLSGNDYVARITGGGDSGWQTVTIDVGNLSAGDHTIELGGYLNKKTDSKEDAFIKFSDVEITGEQAVAEDTSDDTLDGGLGDDALYGQGGDDTLTGGEGNDILTGGDGFQDSLTGGAGNDTLIDTDGVLEAHGGEGSDIITVSFDANWDDDANGATDPTSANRITGGTGADVITVTMASLGFVLALDADEAVADIADGDDTVTLQGIYGSSLITLGGGNDTLVGGDGDDDVYGGLGNDNIQTGAGNDILRGEDGADQLRGGAGNDQLTGGAGNDILFGDDDDDTLDGGDGADELTGGRGNDTLLFDQGETIVIDGVTLFSIADTLVSGGEGIDTIVGTTGNDFIDFDGGVLSTDIEIVRSGAGDDRIVGAMDTTLADQFQVYAGDGDDVVTFFSVQTTNFDLSHITSSYNSTTSEWTVNYTGSTGVQTLTQAELVGFDPSVSGINTLFPGTPNFLSANIIDGGAGKNKLYGSEGSDIIFGGINTTDAAPSAAFDDEIYAGGGNDILIGGAGYDTYFIGRDGGDNFIFDGNTEDATFSNGLIFFEGFENGENSETAIIDYEDDQGNDLGVRAADVQFVNNLDGTWTVSFATSTGSATFAGHEMSEIRLQDNEVGGVTTKYKFDDQGTASFADDTYDFEL